MALSIKSDEADQLARQLSQVTGESMTEAVTKSLRERLERESRTRRKPTKKEKEAELARIRAWLAKTRKNFDFSRPVTKEEFDEASGDNDIMRAMGK
ncbi:MAG TPA: type II toxin-antitoxin system VapB family antitoxin [Rhizomicrobium sp.]|jgi:antitoxin VapB